MKQYVQMEDTLELMENLLSYRHLAPTAPDTMATFPSNTDPFIIEDCPHIYFTGNQPTFDSKVISGS